MKLSREDFDWAVSKELISDRQRDALWTAFETRLQVRPGFGLIHLVYYLGALIVISAMTWFMTEAWDRFADSGILMTATIYSCFFVLAGRHFWHRPGFKIPGGPLFTQAACQTPLIICGLARLTGVWTQAALGITQFLALEVRNYRYIIEIGTVIVGLVVLRFVCFPSLTVPVITSLWGMSLDVGSFLLGKPSPAALDMSFIGVWFGLALLAVAYLIDRRTKKDYALWVYVGGLWAFWQGLTTMESDSEIDKFIYCMINIGLMYFSILLVRRVFFVFGFLGILVYLAHLASLFNNSLLFPVVLILLGIGIIFLAIQYQHRRNTIERSIVGMLPDILRRLLPRESVRKL